MKLKSQALLAVATLAAGSVFAQATAPAPAAAAPAAAPAAPAPAPSANFTVNGKTIPGARIDQIVASEVAQGKAQDTKEFRDQVKGFLIGREVMVQEAEKLGLGKKPEVQAQVDNARQSYMIQAMMSDWLKKNPVTDAEIKAEYDKVQAAVAGKQEYHAKHVLVATEAEANDVIAKLKGGAKIEDLAKEKSKDQGSAQNGGDLGWQQPESLVKEFSDAMVGLQKGAVTEKPVKTQFGFHVIKLEESRPVKLPPFEEIKARIGQNLEQKKLGEYRNSLVAKAKIDTGMTTTKAKK